MSHAVPARTRLSHFFSHEIWRFEHLDDRSARGRIYAVLRVLSLTVTGLFENKAGSRAAALSFSSLLGLGPLVAIVVLIAGFIVKPEQAAIRLNTLLHEIVPQLEQYDQLSARQVPATVAPPGPPSEISALLEPRPAPAASPQMLQLINGFISGSRNSTAGIIGALTLIVIVLQLFTSVENAFNEIWGVHRGRSLFMRVVAYWSVLTLGAVLFFASVAGLSAGAFFNALADHLPLGFQLLRFLRLLLPSLSGMVLVGVLTLFYRFVPNTKVWWRAAFLGAVVVAALLVLNNYLAFLYFRRVVLQTTLYGSLGLLPVLMAGLYVFWLFVLVGGQLSYAVQNVHFRNCQAVWGGLAGSDRGRLSLVVLLTIGRRFQACLPPCSAPHLGAVLRVPTQLLNECLTRLVQMELIMPVPSPVRGADYCYQPARPLSRITLGEFKRLDDDCGDRSASPLLTGLDPLLSLYDDAHEQAAKAAFLQTPLDQLFEEHPLGSSLPPTAVGGD